MADDHFGTEQSVSQNTHIPVLSFDCSGEPIRHDDGHPCGVHLFFCHRNKKWSRKFEHFSLLKVETLGIKFDHEWLNRQAFSMVRESAQRTRHAHTPAFKARVALAALRKDRTMADDGLHLEQPFMVGASLHGRAHVARPVGP
jgi:hypothetical protein